MHAQRLIPAQWQDTAIQGGLCVRDAKTAGSLDVAREGDGAQSSLARPMVGYPSTNTRHRRFAFSSFSWTDCEGWMDATEQMSSGSNLRR